MLNSEEAIEKYLKFEQRCSKKRNKQIDQVKADRKFLSGQQWDQEDIQFFPGNRPRKTVNVLSNSVNCTVNTYATYPYKWYSPDEEADGACEAFLKAGSNARAAFDALYNGVAFGLGYLAIGSETLIAADGEAVEVPALYSIEKVENVLWDPDSTEIDGHDAMEAAITEYRSKDWVSAKYGEEYVTEKGVRPLVNTSDNADPELMVIVTYFRVEDGQCTVYRLLNRDFLDEPVQLPTGRIPVFPIYGERSWDDSDNIIWQGIAHKGAPIQKLINAAFSQLAERIAMSPKPIFSTTGEVVEGFEGQYKTFQFTSNSLLLHNRTTADGKVVLEAPQRIDNRIQFDDLTAIIGSLLELLSTITGVDAKGIMNGDQPQVTATEVIFNERQEQASIRHYYANLRDSFKAAGECTLELLGMGKRRIDVIQGPSEYMQLEIARQELVQLMGMVPETERMKFVNGIMMSHPENAILKNVFATLNQNPAPSPTEQQAMETVEQMKQALIEKNQQLQELQEQIKNMEAYQNNNERDLQAQFVKAKMEHQFKQEDMILQAQLNGGLDANKAAIEAQKSEVDLQKQVLSMEAQEQKNQADYTRYAMDLASKAQQMRMQAAQAQQRMQERQNNGVKNED